MQLGVFFLKLHQLEFEQLGMRHLMLLLFGVVVERLSVEQEYLTGAQLAY
jgi:hypothetical protein